MKTANALRAEIAEERERLHALEKQSISNVADMRRDMFEHGALPVLESASCNADAARLLGAADAQSAMLQEEHEPHPLPSPGTDTSGSASVWQRDLDVELQRLHRAVQHVVALVSLSPSNHPAETERTNTCTQSASDG